MKSHWRLGLVLLIFGLGIGGLVLYFRARSEHSPTASEPELKGGMVRPAMRLFPDGMPISNRPFKIRLYARLLQPGQRAILILPPGLNLYRGQTAQQTFLAPDRHKNYSELVWRVTAAKEGKYRVRVEVPDLGAVSELVPVPNSWSHMEPCWSKQGEPPDPP